MGCSFFMAFVVVQNLHSASPLLADSPVNRSTAKMIKTLGQDQVALLLHHQASEQNRNIIRYLGTGANGSGRGLGGCLYFATQKRILSLVLCGIMLTLVMFQFWGITPEIGLPRAGGGFSGGRSRRRHHDA